MIKPVSHLSINSNFSNERYLLHSKSATNQKDSIESYEPGILTKACALTFLLVPLAIILIPYYIVRDVIISICGTCEEKAEEPVDNSKPSEELLRPKFKLYIDEPIQKVKVGDATTQYEVADQTIFELIQEYEDQDPLVILDLKYSSSRVWKMFPEYIKMQSALRETKEIYEFYCSPLWNEEGSHILISYRDNFMDGSTNTYIGNGKIYRGVNSELIQRTKSRIAIQLQAAFEQSHKVLLVQIPSASELSMHLYRTAIDEKYPGCFEKIVFIPMIKVDEEVKKQVVAKKQGKIHTMADLQQN